MFFVRCMRKKLNRFKTNAAKGKVSKLQSKRLVCSGMFLYFIIFHCVSTQSTLVKYFTTYNIQGAQRPLVLVWESTLEYSKSLQHRHWVTEWLCWHVVCSHVPGTIEARSTIPTSRNLHSRVLRDTCVAHVYMTRFFTDSDGHTTYNFKLLFYVSNGRRKEVSQWTMAVDEMGFKKNSHTHTRNDSLKYSVRVALFLACHVQSVFSGTRQETISLRSCCCLKKNWTVLVNILLNE